MTDAVSSPAVLPARRADLVIRPIGDEGRYVVKLPETQDYFHLGEEEHFLLLQLASGNSRSVDITASHSSVSNQRPSG